MFVFMFRILILVGFWNFGNVKHVGRSKHQSEPTILIQIFFCVNVSINYMVENCQILHISLQKKVLAKFWPTQPNLHFSDLKFSKRTAQNQGRTFFWRKISNICQFLTIEFILTFTQKKIWNKIVGSDLCLLRPTSLTFETENWEVSSISCTTDLGFPDFRKFTQVWDHVSPSSRGVRSSDYMRCNARNVI